MAVFFRQLDPTYASISTNITYGGLFRPRESLSTFSGTQGVVFGASDERFNTVLDAPSGAQVGYTLTIYPDAGNPNLNPGTYNITNILNATSFETDGTLRSGATTNDIVYDIVSDTPTQVVASKSFVFDPTAIGPSTILNSTTFNDNLQGFVSDLSLVAANHTNASWSGGGWTLSNIDSEIFEFIENNSQFFGEDSLAIKCDMGTHFFVYVYNGNEGTQFIQDNFATALYTGTGAAGNNIVTSPELDLSSNGGMILFCGRDTAQNILISDDTRGLGEEMFTALDFGSNSTGTSLTYNSDGFTVGTGGSTNAYNQNSQNYAAQVFLKRSKFFDIITFSGSGSVQNVPHNLGVKPKMMWIKRTDTNQDWVVYLDHPNHNATRISGLNNSGRPNSPRLDSTAFSDTEPTSSQFTVGTSSETNDVAGTYIAYIWGGDQVQVTESNPLDQETPKGGSNILCAFNFPISANAAVDIFDRERDQLDASGRRLPISDANGESTQGTPVLVNDTMDVSNLGFSEPAFYVTITT